ncbi:beta-1,3-galactosyltransferase 6 [Scaptodrosophila lebanonensis]|uniref:Hexosyltransferase n=1 Tax=Drosophila lebanonensis TaxID=7225 RepID=A0A6J2TPI7_DROLE|nr:beta-1,3-galactosyltransferase 6 [Scaptodrosophila lebanonensis]
MKSIYYISIDASTFSACLPYVSKPEGCNMRRMSNLITLFTAITAFFFGCFITKILTIVDKCPAHKSGVAKLEPHPNLFLMVLIMSAPRNVEQRNAMRETWLKLGQPLQQPYFPEENIYLPAYGARGHLQMETVTSQANRLRLYMDWAAKLPYMDAPKTKRTIQVKHFFAIGMQHISSVVRAELAREQSQHNDLLLLPRLHDAYTNLTEKLLQSIDALTHHYEFSYLIKVDDDSYVKLDNLLNVLISYDRKLLRKSSEYRHEQLPQLYWGYFNGRATIKSKGQWSEPNYYLSKHFITYALGGGYVISRKLCEFVANNSQHLSTYVSEDVSMGTWLAPLRHVYRWHDPRFDTTYVPRACRSHHLVLHKRNEVRMRDLYMGKLCSPEQSSARSLPAEYYYDWSKPVDKCCDSLVV